MPSSSVPSPDAAHRSEPEPLEPAWWFAHPRYWELLEFEAAFDGDGRPMDAHWVDRERVLEALVLSPGERDPAFARYLLTQEILRHGHGWGFSHSIELAALLVAEDRRPEDVWLLWSAVVRSFDTWCGLPHELLYAAGVGAVLDHVTASDRPQRAVLLNHLRSRPARTDAAVQRTLTDRRRHYAGILRELTGP
ncbi:hypothetical protein ACWGB8_37705 [Kitasatospora sp. NPDC054939]